MRQSPIGKTKARILFTMEPTKVCTKCGTEKPLSDFYFRKDNQKYREECAECFQKKGKARHERSPEKDNERSRLWRTNHPERLAELSRRWYEGNIERTKETNRAWKIKNLKRHRAAQYAWKKKPGKTQEKLRLANTLRGRIRAALAGVCKAAPTMTLLGCSIEFLREHLEKQFRPGMTWGNYGYKGWWVDHIKPCAKFDLTDPAQQRECFHYTNLQPLWWLDNIKKGAKHA